MRKIPCDPSVRMIGRSTRPYPLIGTIEFPAIKYSFVAGFLNDLNRIRSLKICKDDPESKIADFWRGYLSIV